jgi:transketolase
VVASTNPVPMEFVNLGDRYAESGDPHGLLRKYGLTAEAVVAAVEKVRSR